MKPRPRASLVLFVLASIAIGLAFVRGRRSGAHDTSHATVRVGLVFDVGGRGDKSFNDAAYVGILRAREQLGAAIEYVEPHEPQDLEPAMRRFADQKFDLVVGVGFIAARDIDAVARDYPALRFACVDYAPPFDGTPIPENVTGLAFREEEGSYLVGAVAGLTSKSKHVGFVGGMDMPLIHKFEAGWRAGVTKVCPSCEQHVNYAGPTTDAFRDPAKGKTIAIAQIDAGVDVLFHAAGSTGHGVFEAARDAGVLAIGVDSDQYDEAPGTVITSMIKRADVAVFDAIGAARDRTLHGGMVVLGLKEQGVDYVHEGPHAASLDPAVVERVEALRAQIIRGEITVPDR